MVGAFKKSLKLALPAAVLALAACGGEDTETTYEAGAVDESGGDLIVTDPDAAGVPVELPEVPMTSVPADEAAAAADASMAAEPAE